MHSNMANDKLVNKQISVTKDEIPKKHEGSGLSEKLHYLSREKKRRGLNHQTPKGLKSAMRFFWRCSDGFTDLTNGIKKH